MLRIARKDIPPGGKPFKGKETPEEEALEEGMEDEEPENEEAPEPVPEKRMDDELASYPSCQISQLTVHYQPPTLGPFRCDHCVNWMGDGQCRFVEGEIAPDGFCNIYEPLEELEEVGHVVEQAQDIPKVNSQEMVEPVEEEGEL